ncbi:MAG: hypothetical protein JW934_20080 [Anaerolineae bacterium]|nr:hypothetical protein [Anaerolineae bacterium]
MAFLTQLANLSGIPIVIGLVITASIIAIVRDWRFGLWALLVQYVLLGVLHLRMIPPELALVKVLVGLLICPMIYWSARWVESERTHKAEIERQKIAREQGQVPLPPLSWPLRPTSWVFRLLVVLLLGMVLYSVSTSFPLPLIAADIAPACVWLGLIGLLTLVLTANPLPAGLGLLTLVSGFELYFDVTHPGLAGTGVLAAINLSLGLTIAYLITVDALTGEVL